MSNARPMIPRIPLLKIALKLVALVAFKKAGMCGQSPRKFHETKDIP